jgi:hypothetical protein
MDRRSVLSNSPPCHVTPQCVLRKVSCYQCCGSDGLSTTVRETVAAT